MITGPRMSRKDLECSEIQGSEDIVGRPSSVLFLSQVFDLDGDGDDDVLATSWQRKTVIWFEAVYDADGLNVELVMRPIFSGLAGPRP